MTTPLPRVGDTITTAEQLDALPERSIVRSDDGVWEKVTCQHADGFEHMVWMGSFTEHEAEDVLPRAGEPPVTVVYVPGEQDRPQEDIAAGQPGEQRPSVEDARAEAERRYYDEQTGTWCVTPYDAFAAGAEWAAGRAVPSDRCTCDWGSAPPEVNTADIHRPDCLAVPSDHTATTEDAALRSNALKRAYRDRQAPIQEDDAWAFGEGIRAGIDATLGLLATARPDTTTEWGVLFGTYEPGAVPVFFSREKQARRVASKGPGRTLVRREVGAWTEADQ